MKKFLRKILRPIFWYDLLLTATVLILFVSIMLKFFPDSFGASEHTMELLKTLPYSLATIVQSVFLCGAISGFLFYASVSLSGALADWILNLFEKRRKGSNAVQDNLIQAYVDDATFDRVEQIAEMAGLSVPVFCSCVLQALELDDFADFKSDDLDDDS